MSELARTIQNLEEALLHTDFSNNPNALQTLLAENFQEIGVDGTVVERSAVIEWLLKKKSSAHWQLSEFTVRELAEGVVLANYRAKNSAKLDQPNYQGSMNSSIWQQQGESWQMVFHHGTNISA